MKSFNKQGKQQLIPSVGIALSEKMALQLHVKLNDTIKWRQTGSKNWQDAKIKTLYHAPTLQGAIFSQKAFQKTNNSFHANYIVSKQKNIKKTEQIKQIIKQTTLMKDFKESIGTINLMVYILIIAAVIMALVVLYCLGIIAYTEKYLELATLKALGFKTLKIRLLLLYQIIFFSVISIPFGFAFGYYLINSILKSMGDFLDIIVVINAQTFLICSLGVITLTCSINFFFSRRLKKIDMVSALKGVE